MGAPTVDQGAASLVSALALSPAIQSLGAQGNPASHRQFAPLAAPAQTFLVAVLHRAQPRRPIVFVLDGLKAQEAAFQDLQTWLPTGPDTGTLLFHPDWEILPHEPKLPHVDVVSDRIQTLVTLHTAAPDAPAPILVTTVTALLQRTYSPAALQARLRQLRPGDRCEPLDLVEWLEDQGYEPEAQVTQKGTLALRGGIVDVWPPAAPWPVRLEFFGDELESLRPFDPQSQLSNDRIDTITLTPAGELGILRHILASSAPADGPTESRPPAPPLGTLFDHLPQGALLVLAEPGRLDDRAQAYAAQLPPEGEPFHAPWSELLAASARRDNLRLDLTEEEPVPAGSVPTDPAPIATPFRWPSLEFFRPLGSRPPEPAIAEARRREFFGQLHRWLRGGLTVHVLCNNEGERQRFTEIWSEYDLPESAPTGDSPARLHLHLGALSRGFLCEAEGFVVVTDAEIFGRYKVQRPRRLKSAHAPTSRSLLDIDFTEFEDGDYVVHLEHGIGRFCGLQTAPATPGHRGAPGRPGQECLVIEYAPAQPDAPPPRLFVPVSEAHLVSKYVGAGKAQPPLHTLGGTRWSKARKDAEHAVADLAAELLEIQAAREAQPGHPFPPDTTWQREFEASFLFEETADQQRAIDAAKRDMEQPRPMDRLICGDVGFGKTEVAIRAAFKAVMGGKQVAVLVPTTVLAQQHFRTFRERMSDYPIRVEVLSRFRTRRQQRETLEGLAAGAVDLVIGTHRLLQADVSFKDLGLVVIDEEQRFGVQHKERLKRLRRTVDVLALSATPIPRTLYLALSGARDMSTIETPPQDRLPVETLVAAYDDRLVRDAIRRELNRQGQVFFLHNRVQTIDALALKLRTLVPEARIVVGHGQMDADELEEIMTRFVDGEADVLLSTTIVESGLDIPNANTIIIDRADRFGLSELYQLRGRVGRYKHQAYAYLLIPRHAQLLAEARKRIAAIRQYSSLGSGFKIAMRDLEIRGAGNLLGPQQSGHITAVGFDLYCQLLKQSVASLKGEKIPPRVEVQVRLDFLALNPADEATPAAAGTPSPQRPDLPAVAGLPARYLPEPSQRLEMHRRLAQITTPADLRRLKEDLRDRFGPPPPPVELLLLVAELRLFASLLGVTAIESRDGRLMLTRNGGFLQFAGRFPRLTKREPRARLLEIRRFLGSLSTSATPNTLPPRQP